MPAPVLLAERLRRVLADPAAEAISPPSYIHEDRSYIPVSGSKPENTPSRSSVSWNFSLMIVEALV